MIPLFARLSGADQQRVFAPGSALRVVLATNVAETSLTVPRIRYVVDSGLARVRRYRIRGKVEQLHIEPISQAAANQRAGRCGRVQDGVCIRLFDEDDYGRRPAFSEPEILRSSLAAVILRMRALGLDDVDAFPFLDPPSPKAVADGYALLLELGAMDERRQLTRVGKQLARLPVDPRIARMLLAAHQFDCLAEVTVIAAALAAQDPRERPAGARPGGRPDACEVRRPAFRLPRLAQAVALLAGPAGGKVRAGGVASCPGGAPRARVPVGAPAARVGGCPCATRRDHARDEVVDECGGGEGRWRAPRAAERPARQHRSPRARRLALPGRAPAEVLDPSGLVARQEGPPRCRPRHRRAGGEPPAQAKAGRWVMAAEMVDTGRLYARTVARIRSDWIESAGAHLMARSWTDPHWEKKAGQVMAQERGVLYGLIVYANRRVPYGGIDPVLSRELMIREGLVAGEWPKELPFLRHNRAVIADIERLEHKIRRPDLLVDERALEAWFDSRIPAGICTAAALERWYREQLGSDPQVLQLSRDALLRKDAEGVDDDRFPRHLAIHGVDYALDYHFEPGSASDGVTMTVPLHLLNQVDEIRCEWLVPGMLGAKVEVLLKSLPQRSRRHLLPLAQTAAGFVDAQSQPGGGDTSRPLLAALADHLREQPLGRGEAGGLSRRDAAGSPDDELPGGRRAWTLPRDVAPAAAAEGATGRARAVQLPGCLRADRRTRTGSALPGTRQGGCGMRTLPSCAGRRSRAGERTRRPARGAPSAGAGVRDAPRRAAGPRPGPSANCRSCSSSSRPEGEAIVGFPALVDHGDAVELTVFDEPALAAQRHREGVRRLFMLALAEPVRSFEREVRKNTRLDLLFTTLPGNQTAAGSLCGADRCRGDRPQLSRPRECRAAPTSSRPGWPRAGPGSP